MAPKVLIYGGSGGIGSATGRILGARGYDLHLVGRSEDKLSAIATELDATFTAGDVSDGRRACHSSGATGAQEVYRDRLRSAFLQRSGPPGLCVPWVDGDGKGGCERINPILGKRALAKSAR